jgi:hypothetical protein
MTYSMHDLQRCAEREVAMRQRVYARFVTNGKMTQLKADNEVAMMQAIAEHFAELAEKEKLL